MRGGLSVVRPAGSYGGRSRPASVCEGGGPGWVPGFGASVARSGVRLGAWRAGAHGSGGGRAGNRAGAALAKGTAPGTGEGRGLMRRSPSECPLRGGEVAGRGRSAGPGAWRGARAPRRRGRA